MTDYRGFELIECVCVHPPSLAGKTEVCVYDNFFGIVSDQPTMDAAKQWVDRQIAEADRMLAQILKRQK